jgi:pSer/pThr/pTyr-binding forkhead associated (FHA) protein
LRLVLKQSGWFVELAQPEVLVGRHSSADVRLPLPDVSRRHCRFVFSGDVWQVFDLQSLNGVLVNGAKVEGAVLHQGDTLRIGGFIFQVDLSGGQAVEPPHTMEESAAPRSATEAILPFKPDGLPWRRAS